MVKRCEAGVCIGLFSFLIIVYYKQIPRFHFDVICDLLLNRRTITWNPFGKHLLDSIKCKSLSPSPGACKSMVHTVQLLRHDVYCPITLFFGSVHDYIHLDDGPLMMHINRRGVTIHIPCDSIRFRLLPFNFDYFDSIM